MAILIPWRYGGGAEELINTYIYDRVNCITSAAAFPDPSRAVKLGDCVACFLERPSRSKNSAHLSARGLCPPAVGLEMAEYTFSPSFEHRPSAVYRTSQRPEENFGSSHPPNVPYYFWEAPSITKHAQGEAIKKAYDFQGGAIPRARAHRPYSLKVSGVILFGFR